MYRVPPCPSLCQCDPGVGLSNLWGTGSGLAAYSVRSFVLSNFYELACTDQGKCFHIRELTSQGNIKVTEVFAYRLYGGGR